MHEFEKVRPRTCYNDGLFLYEFSDGDKRERYQGKLAERQTPVPAVERLNSYTCERSSQFGLPSWTKGREIRLLEKPGAGFLDFGESSGDASGKAPIYYFERSWDRHRGVPLQFNRSVIRRFRYYAFQDAFFVDSATGAFPNPRTDPYPVYWIFRGGRVEKIAEIPRGPWRENASFKPIPTKAGLLFASHNFNTRNIRDLGAAGLYIFRDGRTEGLLSAWVPGLRVEVSPSGCQIAFASERFATVNSNSLKVANLCHEGAASPKQP